MPLNRILLPVIGELRRCKINDVPAVLRDLSALEFQVGELIAIGASQVAIAASNLPEGSLANLSPLIRNRVVRVDPNETASAKTLSILTPICTELGMETDHLPYCIQWKNKSPGEPIESAIMVLMTALPNWLLAIQEGLCLDIDVNAFRKSSQILRTAIRSADARASLCVIESALCCYQEQSLDSIEFLPESIENRISLFIDFLDDQMFVALSRESYKLGLPQRAHRASQLISRYVRELLRKPFARKTAQISVRTVAAISRAPVTDTELLDLINFGKYFPPIVSIRGALHTARKNWQLLKPNIVPYPALRKAIDGPIVDVSARDIR